MIKTIWVYIQRQEGKTNSNKQYWLFSWSEGWHVQQHRDGHVLSKAQKVTPVTSGAQEAGQSLDHTVREAFTLMAGGGQAFTQEPRKPAEQGFFLLW